MAMTFGSGDGYGYGNPLWPTRGAITFYLAVKPSSVPSGNRLFEQWGDLASTEQAFLFASLGSGVLGFIVQGASGVSSERMGRQTNTSIFDTSEQYLMVKWRGSSDGGPTIKVFRNGVDLSLSVWLDDDSFAAFNDATAGTVEVGLESIDTIDPIPGDYGEFAVWSDYLPDALCAYATRHRLRPSEIPGKHRVIYAPLRRDGRDVWSGHAVTTSGTPVIARHPPLAPVAPSLKFAPASVAAGPTIPALDEGMLVGGLQALAGGLA